MYQDERNYHAENARAAAEMTPTRLTQVAAEFSEMDGALDALHKAIEELSARLQPLLRESEPARNGGEKAISPPSVPFAAHIRSKRFVVSNFAYRITDLLERLEL